MEGRGSSEGFSLSPRPPKRRRRQRTVYSVEQREELERFFEGKQHPSYEEREALAARLNLREHQVQVWFKNRRAKQTRLQGGTRTRERGPKARASPQGPGVCAPAPAPAAAGPRFPEDPVFASRPGFDEDLELLWNLLFPEDPASSGVTVPPGGAGFHDPFGGFPAAETSASSYTQARWDPAQDTQKPAPAAPAPAPAPAAVPVGPEDLDTEGFWPDLDFTDLLSL